MRIYMQIYKYMFKDKLECLLVTALILLSSMFNVGVALIMYFIIEVAQKGTIKDASILFLFLIIYIILMMLITYLENVKKNHLIQKAMLGLKKI